MLLLDTCTFLWLASEPGRLSPNAVQGISQNAGALLISAMSAFEIALKHGRGRLTLPKEPRSWITRALQLHGVQVIPADLNVCIGANELPPLHNDPFDRIIIATALESQVPVVTPDRLIARYPGVRVLW